MPPHRVNKIGLAKIGGLDGLSWEAAFPKVLVAQSPFVAYFPINWALLIKHKTSQGSSCHLLLTPISERGKSRIGKEADSTFPGLRHLHSALTVQFSCRFHGMRQESHQQPQVVLLDGSCSSRLFHIFFFFSSQLTFAQDQPMFCSPSKPTPEAIPEFLFHLFLGFCCFKVTRIHSAAAPVIYSLRGFSGQRI